jgi:hypothetical protein
MVSPIQEICASVMSGDGSQPLFASGIRLGVGKRHLN